MYTTQGNNAFRAHWLASSAISQPLLLAFKWDVTKIHTPKSQGLLRGYLNLAKDLFKINFWSSFQRDIVFHFENISGVSLALPTVLLRLNNVRGTRFPFTSSSGPFLVKARTCARDYEQTFFCVPYNGISTEAHAWHIVQKHTNVMNSRTPSITHFVEHSTWLYDCKS